MHPTPVTERQAWLDDKEAWRKSLPDPPVPDFLTGLKLRAPDERDFDLRDLPGVSEAIAAGLPDSADITRDFPGPVLNQGAVPSCVSHTMAHMQAIHQWQEERVARVFHAPRAHSETGPVDQGRWPDDLLKYCKDRGMPLTGAESRYRISVYAFAAKTSPLAWEEAIKAAIAAGHPVPICYLLPSQYGAESSGEMTSGYHETLCVGYRPGALLMLNSWGTGWGRAGFGWVPIPFLTQANWQNGHCIAHSGVLDERATPIPDPPPVTKKYFFTAESVSGSFGVVTKDFVYSLASVTMPLERIGSIKITGVRVEGDTNPPDPIDPPDPTGDLKIEATPNGTGWWSFRALDGDRYVTAKIEVSALPGQVKLTQVYGVNRAIAATFWLGWYRGQPVEVIARELNGTRTGQKTITA